MKIELATKITVVVLVGIVVQTTADKVDEALARLGRRLEKEAHLRERLEEQLRLSALAEERRQQMVATKKEMETARITLEKEVLLMETQAAEQQRLVSEARAEDAEVARTLHGYLELGLTFRQGAAREVDAANRRLCEALTEGRGQLQLLCHEARRDPSPELSKVLLWLQQQHFKKHEGGGRMAWPLKLLLIWTGWLVAVWMLLPPRKNTAANILLPHLKKTLKKE